MNTHVPVRVAAAVLCFAVTGAVVVAAQQPPAPSQQPANSAANAAAAPLNPMNHVIYPSKGQTPDQQQKDEQECYNWAAQQTGFDPVAAKQQLNQSAQQAQSNADATQGKAVKGAA